MLFYTHVYFIFPSITIQSKAEICFWSRLRYFPNGLVINRQIALHLSVSPEEKEVDSKLGRLEGKKNIFPHYAFVLPLSFLYVTFLPPLSYFPTFSLLCVIFSNLLRP